MSMYVLVDGGKVVRGPCRCPQSFANISAFYSLADTDKKSHGWYPVNVTKPSYNQYYQCLTGPVFTINATTVDAVWTVADRPLDEMKTAMVGQLKKVTQERILSQAPDYAQRNAALGILSQTEIDALKSTIQTFRDDCTTAETNINTATTTGDAITAYETWESA